MIAKLAIAAAVLFYAGVFSILFFNARMTWTRKTLANKGYNSFKDESEMDIREIASFSLWVESNGFVDHGGDWLSFYTAMICIIFAFAYILLNSLTWYLLLIPIITLSLIAILASLVCWGPRAPGVRFGLLNCLLAGSLGGSLYLKGVLQPFSAQDAAYYYRWLWSPAGAFASMIVACWVLTQPWHLLRLKGTHGLCLCCIRALFLTAGLGAAWFQFGSYPKWYLFGAYVLLALWLMLTRLKPVDWSVVGSGVFLIVSVSLAYWASENPQFFERFRPFTAQGRDAAPIYPSLWPSANRRNADGFLESEDGIPIRILASGPGISLFKTNAMRYPVDVVTTMEPWRRYYAFEKSENAILIGISRTAPTSERVWVYESECYVLRTDLGVKFLGPSQIFESLESAINGKKAIEKDYQWHPPNQEDEKIRVPDYLPVVQTVNGTYRFVRPDGVEWGFPLCWVHPEGGNIQIEKLPDN